MPRNVMCGGFFSRIYTLRITLFSIITVSGVFTLVQGTWVCESVRAISNIANTDCSLA